MYAYSWRTVAVVVLCLSAMSGTALLTAAGSTAPETSDTTCLTPTATLACATSTVAMEPDCTVSDDLVATCTVSGVATYAGETLEGTPGRVESTVDARFQACHGGGCPTQWADAFDFCTWGPLETASCGGEFALDFEPAVVQLEPGECVFVNLQATVTTYTYPVDSVTRELASPSELEYDENVPVCA